MSELHMLNALSYSNDFNLLENDRRLRDELLAPLGWASLDQEVVLRTLKLRLNADIYTTNPDDLSEQLKRNLGSVEEVFVALSRCADFLASEMHIFRPEVVPYRMQIVGLAGVLFDRDWKEFRQQLADWFWISTYTEAFGSSARQSENALSDLISYANRGTFKWSLREKPNVRSLTNLRVDFRAARVKALALALENRRLEHSDRVSAAMVRFGPDAFAQVVFDKGLRGRAGFRFHLAPGEIPWFKSALIEGHLSEDQQLAHLIGDEAHRAAVAGQWDRFIDLRERDVFAFEKDSIIVPAAKRLGLSISNFDASADNANIVSDGLGEF